MAWCWPDDKPLSELMMVCLLTHICVTRPQWDHSNRILSRFRLCSSRKWQLSYGLLYDSYMFIGMEALTRWGRDRMVAILQTTLSNLELIENGLNNPSNWQPLLAHWDQVHASGKHTNISPENGLSSGRCQAIISINTGILLTEPSGTNFS